LDFPRIAIPGERLQLATHGAAKQALEPPPRHLREIADRKDPYLRQACLGHRAHAPHQLNWQAVQEVELPFRIDHHEPVWLCYLRGDFCEVFGARHANGDRKPQLLPHTAAHRFCDLRWWAKQALTPSDVGKCLVDREPLDERCEVAEDLHDRVPQPSIFPEVPADKMQLRAHFARPSRRHSAPHPESLGLIGCGEHDPAADGDGSAAQGWVKELFDRCIERVEVGVQDRGRSHVGDLSSKEDPRKPPSGL
jgi:hypothetical protein